jgi:pilus assembly protein Flp/PilA
MDTLRPLGGRVVVALVSAWGREDGQSLVEYALILLLVSTVSIAVLTTFGTGVSSLFSRVNADL